MSPAALLVRGWVLAADRRAVAAAAVEFSPPSPGATAYLARQATHARRVRRLGWLAGVAAVVTTVVLFGEASVFLWLPALAAGLPGGGLLAAGPPPRARPAGGAPP